ncbi:adenosylcobinamide-phosphate synthase [Enterovibrio norvegicus FF-162]|uniref:Adenosylcobinamide-phosphate synthase n=1 Tax=Enterovibrio norvegicus FF-454 TaxID=1185651 RepID=A0A1E5BWI8_9GAMM|nr:cobalamin biosynthesis family protein [Enterovibrio norvegicus]OEE57618.1 adenosylcobinamide-phosphate synthase [Enterovibrio norvegicus FF-454]OEE81669.1 adenosylcobinamide-phosphate synthase [Enterovibrio norvegicus FF-162]
MTELPTPLEALLGYSTLLAMWGALLLHWFFPIPREFNPLSLWRQVATAIAEKVNHADDPPSQQRLAGGLSLAIMWLTLATLLIALQQIVWVPWLFDLLLLWLSLSWKPLTDTVLELEATLLRQDKPGARTLLAKSINRDTQSLSPVGIAKAGCETLLMGYSRGLIGILFWYAIGGGIAAFLYTLIVQLARCWPTRRGDYAQFGLATSVFLSVVDAVPARLFALLIAMGHRFEPSVTAIREQGRSWSANGAGWILAASGAKFQLALGGPAIYDDEKISRPRIGGEIAPSPLHLALLNQQLRQKALLWILTQSFLMWFAHGLL